MGSEGSWRRRGGMARQLKNKCIHYSLSCEWGSRARRARHLLKNCVVVRLDSFMTP